MSDDRVVPFVKPGARDRALEAMKALCPHGHPDFYEALVDMGIVHSEKNYDYAGDGDPLGNFKRVAKIVEAIVGPENGPAKVAVIYVAKQFDAVVDMLAHGRTAKVESLDDKLQDLSIYPQLIRLLLKESTQHDTGE
ncbi:hypothetical protein LCGC14_1057800 [marine sediment metagenome]|uniref:Uncharacterized protein n=1 Tax=marine sediment metagenome TaxID=412755 RepID=A0A0F9N8W2_9ZZZZ